jgi:hypothetical protein
VVSWMCKPRQIRPNCTSCTSPNLYFQKCCLFTDRERRFHTIVSTGVECCLDIDVLLRCSRWVKVGRQADVSDPDHAHAVDAGSVGLSGMRERAVLAGGHLGRQSSYRTWDDDPRVISD